MVTSWALLWTRNGRGCILPVSNDRIIHVYANIYQVLQAAAAIKMLMTNFPAQIDVSRAEELYARVTTEKKRKFRQRSPREIQLRGINYARLVPRAPTCWGPHRQHSVPIASKCRRAVWQRRPSTPHFPFTSTRASHSPRSLFSKRCSLPARARGLSRAALGWSGERVRLAVAWPPEMLSDGEIGKYLEARLCPWVYYSHK